MIADTLSDAIAELEDYLETSHKYSSTVRKDTYALIEEMKRVRILADSSTYSPPYEITGPDIHPTSGKPL